MQPLQTGFTASHFFFRALQAKQPGVGCIVSREYRAQCASAQVLSAEYLPRFERDEWEMATCVEVDTNDKSSLRGACLKEKRVAS